VTIARSAPAVHYAVTARFSDYRGESSTYSVQCSRFALQLPGSADSGLVLCGLPSLHLTLADLTRKPAPSALTIQPALWFAPSLLCLPSRGGASFRFYRPLAPFEAVDSIRRFPSLRFVRIFGLSPSTRTFLHHQPPRSQAYFIPEAPMGFPLQGFPLRRRSTCSHTLHSLMLLRRRWPPYLLPRALGCNAIRSPFSFRVFVRRPSPFSWPAVFSRRSGRSPPEFIFPRVLPPAQHWKPLQASTSRAVQSANSGEGLRRTVDFRVCLPHREVPPLSR